MRPGRGVRARSGSAPHGEEPCPCHTTPFADAGRRPPPSSVALVPGRRVAAAGGATAPRRAAARRPGRAAGRDLRRRPAVRRRSHRRPDRDVINGIKFPTPSQPVEGFSGDRRRPPPRRVPGDARQRVRQQGQLARLPIRAYYLQPDFKTADGGIGCGRRSATSSSSAIPTALIGFPIVNEGTRRAAADRRRHRSRVAAARPQRRPVGRRRVRSVDPALRRRRVGCSSRRSRARRADVAEQPVPRDGRRRRPSAATAAASRRWR